MSTEPSPPSPHAPSRWQTIALTLSVIVLSVLVLVLSRANARLRAEMHEAVQQMGSLSLPLGETVPALDCRDSADQPSDAMRFDDGRLATAIYIHKASCGACESSAPLVRELARVHAEGGVRFVGVQTDESAPLKDLGDHITTCAVHDAGATWLKRVPLAPAMLLIDAKGVVRESWFGAPLPAHMDRMEAAVRAAESNTLDAHAPFAGGSGVK
jgi:hypothetical protein